MTDQAPWSPETDHSSPSLRLPPGVPDLEYLLAMPGGMADYYQSAVALAERGRLARVVTDVYTPDVLLALGDRLPRRAADLLRRRSAAGLPSRLVTSSLAHETLLRLQAQLPKALATTSNISRNLEKDVYLGRRAAGILKRRPSAALIYYNHWPAFAEALGSKVSEAPYFTIQHHPVPSQVRSALHADREVTGITAGLEAEEQLDPEDIARFESALRRADGVLAASSFVRDGLLGIGIPSNRIRVIPYGGAPPDPRLVDEDSVLPLPDRAERSSAGPIRLLWVGSLVYRKGPHHLASALRSVRSQNVQLTIVSRSTRGRDLFDGVPGVTFAGAVPAAELTDLYDSHDLFCLTSVAEGFGMVVAEALGKGLPVLATTATGARDIVQSGRNGVVVPAGDPDALAGVIDQLAADRDYLRRLRQGARASADGRRWSRFRQLFSLAVSELEQEYRTRGATLDLRP